MTSWDYFVRFQHVKASNLNMAPSCPNLKKNSPENPKGLRELGMVLHSRGLGTCGFRFHGLAFGSLAKKDVVFLVVWHGLAIEFLEKQCKFISFVPWKTMQVHPSPIVSCFFGLKHVWNMSYSLFPQLKHLGVQDNFLQQLHHCIATRALLVVLEALWRSRRDWPKKPWGN